MQYQIPYTVSNQHMTASLSDIHIDGEIGARFDRFSHERISGQFAMNEILRETEECFRDKFDDEFCAGKWRGEFWGKLMLSACRVCRYKGNEKLNKILLFVVAIAIHNLPEGIAAGVGFGSGNTTDALIIAGGIALQNIPEGMVLIAPMLGAGISPKKSLILASFTGVIEIVGTFLGYFAVSISTAILPFALAVAGGTMLYVISDEMIPETHAHGSERGATYALLIGFCLMLVSDVLLG